jgi:hypothetical protein
MKGEIMARILFILLFTATLAITAFSQTQNQPENAPVCNLSLSQAPAIRGIRLGMKPDEWLKLFPGSAQDEKIKAMLDEPPMYPEYGLKYITFYPTFRQNQFSYLPREEFSGIKSVSLTLFDNQILAFQISYDAYDGIDKPWDNAAQLIPIFSERFKLPQVSAWDNTGSQAKLKCAGFEMTLTAGNGPIASLISSYNYRQIIQQRREADKQKGREAFKP